VRGCCNGRTERTDFGSGWAGLAAGALALGVSELLAGLIDDVPSLVGTVGDAVIDLSPTWLVDFGIDTFGQNDKAVLTLGILALCALGAVLVGRAAARRFGVAVAGFVAFGVVGVLAAARDDAASDIGAAISAVVSVAVGLAVLRFLVRTGSRPVAADPGRRRFLVGVTTVGFAAALGAVGGRVLDSARAAAARAGVMLPRPRRPAAPPPAGASLDVPGISPLVTPNDRFYRIDTRVFGAPTVDIDGWRLRVKGMVDRPFELSFDELLAMAEVEEHVTLACVSNEVGGDLIGTAKWQGVPLRRLLERAGVQAGADQIVGRAVDGFTAGFPVEAATDGRPALVAVGMNGEPLPSKHGFPARLVVAGLYGYVSATKWLEEIELTRFDAFEGYWIPRGWSQRAPIKTQSRIDRPFDGETVAAGTVAVAGVAWAPTRGIERVEVRVDGGRWEEARLAEPLTVNTWRQWVYEWDAPPGEHHLEVRATDGDGDVQTDRFAPPAPDGATGWHRIDIEIS